jgi:hypothetical protein
VNAVFSSLFKSDLFAEGTRYDAISVRLGQEFRGRVKEASRAVIHWNGGDHIGPHGYPCRNCRPFPFLVYYEIQGDTIYFLGVVHERRHPDYLRQKLGDPGA